MISTMHRRARFYRRPAGSGQAHDVREVCRSPPLADSRRPALEGCRARLGNPLMLVDHGDNAPPLRRCSPTLTGDASIRMPLPPSSCRGAKQRLIWLQSELIRQSISPRSTFAVRGFLKTRPCWDQLAEAQALLSIDSILARRSVAPWSLRIPIGLVAMDRVATQSLRLPAPQCPGWCSATQPWCWFRIGNRVQAVPRHPGTQPSVSSGPRRPSPIARPCEGTPPTNWSCDPWPRVCAAGHGRCALAVENQSAGSSGRTSDGIAALAWRRIAGRDGGRSAPARAAGSGGSLAPAAQSRGRVLPWAVADRIACTQLHLGDPMSAPVASGWRLWPSFSSHS